MQAARLLFTITFLLLAPNIVAASDTNNEVISAIMAQDNAKLSELVKKPDFDVKTRLDGGKTFLHLAAEVGNVELIKSLLDADAEIDAIEEIDGWTPIMTSVFNGHADATALLKNRGANLKVKGTDKSTVYSIAEFSGLSDILGDEIAQAEEPKTKDLSKLLLMAAEAGDAKLAAQLLDEGADPNSKTGRGWTPLMYAALRLDSTLTNLLLKYGAQISEKNHENHNIIHIALISGQKSKLKLNLYIDSIRSKINTESCSRCNDDIDYTFSLARKLKYSDYFLEKYHDIFTIPVPRIVPVNIDYRSNNSKREKMEIQKYLTKLGLYKGEIDGIIGGNTRKSIYSYYESIRSQFIRTAKQIALYCEMAEFTEDRKGSWNGNYRRFIAKNLVGDKLHICDARVKDDAHGGYDYYGIKVRSNVSKQSDYRFDRLLSAVMYDDGGKILHFYHDINPADDRFKIYERVEMKSRDIWDDFYRSFYFKVVFSVWDWKNDPRKVEGLPYKKDNTFSQWGYFPRGCSFKSC